ncbi:Glycosyl transferase family 2 [Faunimonas pinastri]|uniref:Glycosyl transferase family 2 n=1 Tax=Faunimonas pinastri TaxID=1855383 RepID=A0A1H9CQC1_9HYPH|nr:glycosyltransferase [Faunimonas pinastri]SEQ02808.1 Glycosyl transferase family 2 [Faunimonas pinastri]
MSATISVVLPVRNGEAFIASAVESIRRQTFADFELLLVDDGSVDGTPAIVADLARQDSRIRLLHQPGLGLVPALSLGLQQSTGAFVARMDGDDLAAPERLERQLAFLSEHSHVALVGTQIRYMDATGRLTGDLSHYPLAPGDVETALMERGCCISHPTIMARRDALVSIGGYRSAFLAAEDYDLFLRLADSHALANLPEALLDYRRHDGQVSSAKDLRQRFSHDLSVLAARRRRAGAPDPTLALVEPPALDPAHCGFGRLDPSVQELVMIYATLQHIASGVGTSDELLLAGVEAAVRAAGNGFLGVGRKQRSRLLSALARTAAQHHLWRLAGTAASMAFREAPGRAPKLLFRPPAGMI